MTGAGRYALVPLGYVLWLANGGLGLVLVVLARQFLLRLDVVFRWGPYAMGAVDKLGLLVLGTFWLGWLIFMESHYREAAMGGAARLAQVAWRSMLAVGFPLLMLAAALAIVKA